MGAKVTFDGAARTITVTEAPDGNGQIVIDVQEDLYSDAKEDWRTVAGLAAFPFPFEVDGGRDQGGGEFSGRNFTLKNGAGDDWRIVPYDADHELILVGNINGADVTAPLNNTRAGRTIMLSRKFSSLAQAIAVGSGVLPADIVAIAAAVKAELLTDDTSFAGADIATIKDLSEADEYIDRTNGTYRRTRKGEATVLTSKTLETVGTEDQLTEDL